MTLSSSAIPVCEPLSSLLLQLSAIIRSLSEVHLTASHCTHSLETPGRFVKLTVTGEMPSVRERTTASVIGSSIYLFGGYNRSKESYYNELYQFNCGIS